MAGKLAPRLCPFSSTASSTNTSRACGLPKQTLACSKSPGTTILLRWKASRSNAIPPAARCRKAKQVGEAGTGQKGRFLLHDLLKLADESSSVARGVRRRSDGVGPVQHVAGDALVEETEERRRPVDDDGGRIAPFVAAHDARRVVSTSTFLIVALRVSACGCLLQVDIVFLVNFAKSLEKRGAGAKKGGQLGWIVAHRCHPNGFCGFFLNAIQERDRDINFRGLIGKQFAPLRCFLTSNCELLTSLDREPQQLRGALLSRARRGFCRGLLHLCRFEMPSIVDRRIIDISAIFFFSQGYFRSGWPLPRSFSLRRPSPSERSRSATQLGRSAGVLPSPSRVQGVG